jgi:hypothetical protein
MKVREKRRIQASLILVVFFFGIGFTNHGVVERSVIKPNGAAFTYHSHVTNQENGEYGIVNFIRNDSKKEPLTVVWEAGRIICTGFHQLDPGETDYGKGYNFTKAPVIIPSTIKYSVDLKQEENARGYINPEEDSKKAKQAITEYIRESADRRIKYRIRVISTLESVQLSKLELSVTSGFSLVMPYPLGEAIKDSEDMRASNTWEVGEPIIKFDFLAPTEHAHHNFAFDWLIETLQSEHLSFLVLKNKLKDQNTLSVRLTGHAMELKRVNLIAFNAEHKGMIGLAANIFVPVVSR